MATKFKRIVVKFGSGILSTPRGTNLDQKQIRRLAAEVASLIKLGHECLIVSSGAVAAGLGALGLKTRPEQLAARQACAAVGQGRLMGCYNQHFSRHKLTVAQILLTHADLDSRIGYSNIRNTVTTLIKRKVVPIFNENDTVAVEELRFGDNDRLSAEIATMVNADLLILLTTADGLLDSDGKLIPEVKRVDDVTKFARSDKGRLSVGGMPSKLQAVKIAVDSGIPTIIASGTKPKQIIAAAAGKPAGTFFITKR